MRASVRGYTAAALLMLSACAWEVGEPFAVLSPHLDARVVAPPDRDLGMGWQKLASGYELRIERMDLGAGELDLVDAGGSAAGFDPSRPPPGYSLCHNGHCHADDGRLVSYEEVAAELGQGSGATSVVVMPVGDLDLIAGVSRALACEPGCDLPLAHITLARLPVTRVQAAGRVRDPGATPRIEGELAWTLDLDAERDADAALTLIGPLDLAADRRHAPAVTLEIELAVTARLFDLVDWAALDQEHAALDQQLAALDADPAARAAILDALARLELASRILR